MLPLGAHGKRDAYQSRRNTRVPPPPPLTRAVLVGLYEEPERPPNAVDYIKRCVGMEGSPSEELTLKLVPLRTGRICRCTRCLFPRPRFLTVGGEGCTREHGWVSPNSCHCLRCGVAQVHGRADGGGR